MTMAAGTDVYNVDAPPVLARGASYNEAELNTALTGSVSEILWDVSGTGNLEAVLASVATTDFDAEGVRRILTSHRVPENWRVGECLAEAFLVEHRGCEFPWPSGRDLKNPCASPAGTDLVGFQRIAPPNDDYCFAFGEVKTSEQQAWPPNVMDGRNGLQKQLEDLRDSTEVKDALVKYLGHHSHGAGWSPHYKKASQRYLANPQDVSLFGILVRDVEPKPEDLKVRAISLAKKCPAQTKIELRAMYLPGKTICSLGGRVVRAKEDRHGLN
jgi:hypothetical protein